MAHGPHYLQETLNFQISLLKLDAQIQAEAGSPERDTRELERLMEHVPARPRRQKAG